MFKKKQNIVELSKCYKYKDGKTDWFGCPFYYIYVKAYDRKALEYFEKNGWHIEIGKASDLKV